MIVILVSPYSAFSTSLVVGGEDNSETALKIGTNLWPNSMNWFNVFGWYQMYLMFDTLGQYNEKLEVTSNLASSWHHSDDLKTWTFILVENAAFHDGAECTAKDVVFTINYILENLPETTYLLLTVEMIENATAPDDHTVVVQLNDVYNEEYFVTTFVCGMPVLPEHIWSEIPKENLLTAFGEAAWVIGTGIYQYVEYRYGEYYELKANKNWRGVAPNFDRIIWTNYDTEEALVEALRSGEIDCVDYIRSPASVDILQADPNVKVIINPGPIYHFIVVNVYPYGANVRPSLLDKRVRQAMAHAIDKQQICELVWSNYADPAFSILQHDKRWFNSELRDKPLEFNLTLAADILTQAGYIDKDGDGVREDHEGKPLSYYLMIWSPFKKELRTAEMIADWWSQIGIELNYGLADWETIADVIWGKTGVDFDFDLILSGAGSGMLMGSQGYYLQTALSKMVGLYSDAGYVNPDFDTAFYQQQRAQTYGERKAILDSMQEMLHYDVPYIYLAMLDGIWAYRSDRIENVPSGVPFGTPIGTSEAPIPMVFTIMSFKKTAAPPLISTIMIALIAVAAISIGAVVVIYVRRSRK
jgi:peptide/nickel transport system substrate-binding protein